MLESIGRLYGDWGEDQKAIEFFYQALAVPRSIGDRVGEAFTLSKIGSFYLSLGESQKAIDHYN
jgi:tetratricopeptide (TPR) repeat protein